jgi:hypothetical protein
VKSELVLFQLSFTHAQNGADIADDERAIGFLTHQFLHIDRFKAQELFGGQLHRFSISVVRRGSADFRLFALVLGEFLLILGLPGVRKRFSRPLVLEILVAIFLRT